MKPLVKLKNELQTLDLTKLHSISSETYHSAEHPGVTRGDLLNILVSPQYYKYQKENPREPTKEMLFGQHAHCGLLEPELFEARYTYYPKADDFVGQSKSAKQAREDFKFSNPGKIILDAEDYERIGKIIESVYRSKEAAELLKGEKEKTKFFIAKPTETLCKVRPDCLQEKQIVDVKITADASEESFRRTAAQLDYHIQAAFYMDAFGLDRFIFLCIEKNEPFDMAIYELDKVSIDLGRTMYQRALQTYKRCVETNIWEGYSKEMKTVSLPQWKFYDKGEKL